MQATLLAADHAAAAAANGLVRGHPTLQRVVALAARWLAAVEVALVVALGVSGRRQVAVRALLSVGVVYGLVEGAGRVWRRARPFERLPSVERLVAHAAERSFPSRHVASAFAMAAVAASARPPLARGMRLVGFGLGLARVGAGVHYPSDVVAGALLGTLVGRALRGSGA